MSTWIQANYNILILIGIAGLIGYVEQHVYRNNYRDYGWHFLGFFSPRYHLPNFISWMLVCSLADYTWFIGIFAVIEDFCYFLFHPTDTLEKDDWICRMMGSFSVLGLRIPNAYLLGGAFSYFLYKIPSWI
jgi:hypothetical protein